MSLSAKRKRYSFRPAFELNTIRGLSWPDPPAADLVLLIAIGMYREMIFVSGESSLQLDVPPELKGRMVGFFYVLVSGCAALGGLLMGFFFNHIGIEESFFAVGAVVLAAGLVLRLRSSTGESGALAN